jgi:hypothetical protein
MATVGLGIAATIVAAGFGTAVASAPLQAFLALVLVPLALGFPTASLGVILAVTVLVPFDTQNHFSLGGGAGTPGLLAVDVLMLLGLCRVGVLLLRRRLALTSPILFAGALLIAMAAALAHGVLSGASASDAGTEARCLVFGLGAFVLAWPLLDHPGSRARLYGTLLALGIALGLWGIIQVLFNVAYTSGGDVGVRPGIDQVAAVGGGQLQGGLYAFPIAAILSFAVLVSPTVTSLTVRRLAAAVFGLNSICVLLTYERSIWGAAVIGCLLAALRSGPRAWPSAGRWLALGVAAILAYTAASPGTLATTAGRLKSVFSYTSQSSAQSRAVESQAVLRAIRASPITGAGFGATVTWGKSDEFATKTTNFTHNGYLWLAWKVGTPVALVLVAALLCLALRRGPPSAGDRPVVRVGSQAALAASLLVCLTFPEFNALDITAMLGVLAAGCLMGGRTQRGLAGDLA